MAEDSSADKLDVTFCDFQFVSREHTGLNGDDVNRTEFGWGRH